MSVTYHPAAPPLVGSADSQKLSQYLFGELQRLSQALIGAAEAPHAICKYNGVTDEIIFSEGVDTVTKVGTGVYDVNLREPLRSLIESYGSVASQTSGQCVAEIDVASSNSTKIRVTLATATSGSAVNGQFILVIYG